MQLFARNSPQIYSSKWTSPPFNSYVVELQIAFKLLQPLSQMSLHRGGIQLCKKLSALTLMGLTKGHFSCKPYKMLNIHLAGGFQPVRLFNVLVDARQVTEKSHGEGRLKKKWPSDVS